MGRNEILEIGMGTCEKTDGVGGLKTIKSGLSFPVETASPFPPARIYSELPSETVMASPQAVP